MAEAAPSRAIDRALRRPRMFFGWWVVTAGAGLQFIIGALLGQAYGAYIPLLKETFGWSQTALAGASSLREAESGILGPIQGWLVDRLGPRAVIRIGLCILGAGFMAFSQVQSLLAFYVVFFIMAIGASMSGWTSITTAAVRWFERRRSTAISITSAGYALGGMAIPLTVLSLERLGWRETAFLSGVIVLVAGLPITLLIKNSPHEIGLGPDGDQLDPHARQLAARGITPIAPTDFTLREAMRERSFWFVALGHASALFIVSAMNVHLVSFLKESQGYTLGQASAVVFSMTLLQFVGTLSGGPIGDRFSKRWLVTVCMGMHVGGLLMLSHATSVVMVGAFAALHGLAWGWRGPQMAAIRADYFGRSSFGKILGVSNLVIIIGTILGPIIAGVLYDQTGTYGVGFDTLAVIAGLGSVFFILAKKPVKRPAK